MSLRGTAGGLVVAVLAACGARSVRAGAGPKDDASLPRGDAGPAPDLCFDGGPDDVRDDYEGHLEPVLDRDDPECVVVCGEEDCCPSGTSCALGAAYNDLYCATCSEGRRGHPCNWNDDDPCEPGLDCIGPPCPGCGPAVCTILCRTHEDCAPLGEGFCCGIDSYGGTVGSCRGSASECVDPA